MNSRIIIAVLILLVTVSAYAQTECKLFKDNKANQLVMAKPASAGFDPRLLAKVDKQINNDIRSGFPGAALLIIKDGKVVKETVYGYRLKYNLAGTRKLLYPNQVHCDTMFDLASNTKMYATNYAIMHLVSLGKLDINKPVNYYLPKYAGCDSNNHCRKDILVRDLIAHQAGYIPNPKFYDPESIVVYGSNLYSQNRDLTKEILFTRMPFATNRGLAPVYSDVDYMLLGLLIEQITQMRLDDYVKATFYSPLGLKNTTFNPLANKFKSTQCAATEPGGNTRGKTVRFPNIRTRTIDCMVHDENTYYSMAGVSGHAGLFSNLHDMAILVDIMLLNGQYGDQNFFTKSVIREFTTPLAQDDSYALGWRMSGSGRSYKPFGNYASRQAYGHTGWTGTLTLIDPQYNMAIVLLTNKRHALFRNGRFATDDMATSEYHKIIDLIYMALK